SGIPGAPIILDSYGEGDKPVITSFKSLTKWITKGGNIYETKLEEIHGALNVLTIDKVPFPVGRYPNPTEENSGYLTIGSTNQNNFISSKELQAPVNFSGGEVVIRKNSW